MRKTMLWALISAVLVVFTSVQAYSSRPAEIAVGVCQPQLTSFSTIQAAVDAAPHGATILVCPGAYPEQVLITTPLTLQGVVAGNAGAAVISPPVSGLVSNGYSTNSGAFAAQVLVHNTTGVAIYDITVDGAGAACPSTSGQTSIAWFGIAYDADTGGMVTNSVVRNVTSDTCQTGASVLADVGSELVFKSNSVHDFSQGVYGYSAKTLTLSSNTIARGNFGIHVGGGPTPTALTISNNTITGIAGCPVSPSGCQWFAIFINYNNGSTTISGNVIWGDMTPLGILVGYSQNVKVTNNDIAGEHVGVFLNGVSGAMMKTNRITNTITAITIDGQGSSGGNTLQGNIINEAPCGTNIVASTGDTLTGNTFLNVTKIAGGGCL